ncbi:amino acid ABC transporter permease [Weissella koreensis KACC 15510]|uniref:amino acid ABC transporter permease n=1 Tax=Weissella koreensis TaxID=165096 RepID=UPI0002175A2B|nr:amino acid ABC transporter permease [Weissella koreensis]AEJ22961.1 amino acid ABC transporter permease [Weissella koreensis KACC 15510]
MEFIQLAVKCLPQLFQAAILYTLPLAAISFALGLIIATGTALIRVMTAPRNRLLKIIMILVKGIASFYIWLFRSTPMLVQLFIAFYGLPSANIDFFANAWISAITVFSLNTGAYAAETIRASILSVDRGQLEAAQSVGLSRIQAYWYVVLPQAVRIAIPPLSNSLISLVKDTSLASVITIVETFYLSQQIASENYQTLSMYILVAIVYAVITTILTFVQRWLEQRTSRYLAS